MSGFVWWILSHRVNSYTNFQKHQNTRIHQHKPWEYSAEQVSALCWETAFILVNQHILRFSRVPRNFAQSLGNWQGIEWPWHISIDTSIYAGSVSWLFSQAGCICMAWSLLIRMSECLLRQVETTFWWTSQVLVIMFLVHLMIESQMNDAEDLDACPSVNHPRPRMTGHHIVTP